MDEKPVRLDSHHPRRPPIKFVRPPGIQQNGRSQGLQDRYRFAYRRVHRGSESAADLEARLLGLCTLLLYERIEADSGCRRKGQDSHQGQQEQSSAKRNIAHQISPDKSHCPDKTPADYNK